MSKPKPVGVRRHPRGFRVVLGICLLAGNGMLYLSRRLRLPFAPYPGLELLGITTDECCAETIVDVAWDASDRCFRVELLECACPEETIGELIDHYGPGWRLHEPGTEPVADS